MLFTLGRGAYYHQCLVCLEKCLAGMDLPLELRHLRYFVGIAEAGSFTAAAERLHKTQPSLSRQMRDLEMQIGTPLFERTNRPLTLTPAGEVLLEEARQLLAQADAALTRTRQAAPGWQGRLTLGFMPGIEAQHLGRILDIFNGKLAPLELETLSRPSPVLIEELQARRLDAAFIRLSAQAQGLSSRTLLDEPLIVILPADHPLAQEECLDLKRLADQPCIQVSRLHAPVLHEIVQAYAVAQGVTLHSAHESENLLMALSLVRSSGGFCLLPDYTRALCPPGLVARSLDDGAPHIELALAWHPENRSAALSVFLEAFCPRFPESGE